MSLSCFSFNDRAIKVYERLGFVKEGVARESIWFNRKFYDEIHYSMLESEWETLRGQQGAEGRGNNVK